MKTFIKKNYLFFFIKLLFLFNDMLFNINIRVLSNVQSVILNRFRERLSTVDKNQLLLLLNSNR